MQRPKRNRPSEPTGRVTTTLRIDPEKLERLKIAGVRRRTSLNDLLLEAIDDWLAKHGRGAA